MKVQKGIWVGLVAALLAGAAQTVAETGMVGASSNDAAAVVIVPSSRVGDRVLYANFEKTGDSPEWTRVQDSGLEVGPIREQPDKYGGRHDVVPLYLDRQAGWMPAGVAGTESGWGFNFTVLDYVDLETRERLGSARDGTFSSRSAFQLNSQQQYADVVYGPEHRATPVFGPSHNPWHPHVLSQGRTYSVGQNVDPEAVELMATESIFYAGYGGPQFGNLTIHDAWVSGRIVQAGSIGGLDAVDERIRGCVSFDLGPNRWWDLETEGMWFLGVEIPIPSNVCFEIDRWLTSDRPYPILVERHLVVNGTQKVAATSSLIDYREGSAAVPWGRAPPTFSVGAPTRERSPLSQRFPADGLDAPYGYRLADAKTAVEGDLTLLQFRAWSATHEENMLVGARLNPTGQDLAGRRWTLVYGTPTGSYFVASSERPAAGLLAKNDQLGEVAGPTFTPNDFPPGPLTLSAGSELYERYVEGGSNAAPNLISWGFRYASGRIAAWTTPESVYVAPAIYPTYTYVGYTSEAEPTEAARVWAAPNLDGSRWIMYEEPTGVLIWSRQTSQAQPYAPLPSPLEATPPQAASTQSESVVPTPNLKNAAIVSGSFLALFLAVYFFPLLKWAGGSMAPLLPGYAKLHKSELLNNEVRDKIVQAVRADPGITPPQLQELTGAGWSTVVYHLGVLEKNKVVSSLIDGRHKRFFPHETVNWSDRGRIAVLKNLKSRELYELVLQEPGLGPEVLAQRVGITRPAIYWHTNRLEKAGLLGKDRAGLRTVFFANPVPATPYDAKNAVEVA